MQDFITIVEPKEVSNIIRERAGGAGADIVVRFAKRSQEEYSLCVKQSTKHTSGIRTSLLIVFSLQKYQKKLYVQSVRSTL